MVCVCALYTHVQLNIKWSFVRYEVNGDVNNLFFTTCLLCANNTCICVYAVRKCT